ncbi:hypothetical protein [[Clostridium] colinum]|uniref:hypothetical protein n=1 Tax=[Clostridium] colinum TaxID=36835 RepID=UPI002024CE98|nr:hypothetical protein [[Clostridium] colinum]
MKELEEIYNKLNNLNYILDRKIELLNLILNITKNQEIVFKNNDNNDTNSFINISLDEKQKFIDEIINIDNMFLDIFESFNGNLNQNKQIFKEDIKILKNKIEKITEIDFKIRLQEEKNSKIYKNINDFRNINLNTDKVKTLKVSKNELLKKYTNNNRKK